MNHLKASDAELLVASDKDAAAFRALYNRYTEQINGYHLRRCHDQQAALDLTAETFAQAWSRPANVPRPGGRERGSMAIRDRSQRVAAVSPP